MICCDPDELQYGKQVNDSTWEFVQVTHPKLLDLYSGVPELFCEAYEASSALNSSCVKDAVHSRGGVVWSVIDLKEYSDEEVENYISCYGYTLKDSDCNRRTPIKRLYGNWQQICCECIFEQDNQATILENLNGLI